MHADPLCEVGCPYAVRGFAFDYVKLMARLASTAIPGAAAAARRCNRATIDELWRLARVDRLVNVKRPYLEAVA